MNFFNLPFWQSFVSNLLATIIGAGLGVFGALLLNRYVENRNKKERKKKILGVLLDETKENINILDIWEKTGKDFNKPKTTREPVIYLYTFLYTESWDAFSNGGELEWIDDPLTLNILAANYNHINAVKYLANICINFAFANSQIYDLEPFMLAGKKLEGKAHDTLTALKDTKNYLEEVLK
jgi:hypothetical protein